MTMTFESALAARVEAMADAYCPVGCQVVTLKIRVLSVTLLTVSSASLLWLVLKQSFSP